MYAALFRTVAATYLREEVGYSQKAAGFRRNSAIPTTGLKAVRKGKCENRQNMFPRIRSLRSMPGTNSVERLSEDCNERKMKGCTWFAFRSERRFGIPEWFRGGTESGFPTKAEENQSETRRGPLSCRQFTGSGGFFLSDSSSHSGGISSCIIPRESQQTTPPALYFAPNQT